MDIQMIGTALLEDSKALDWTGTESFMFSYDHFLRFFQQRTSLTLSYFVIGAHFTYGWMPTILDFRPLELQTCLNILNKVHSHQTILDSEILTLASVVNGSLVGVSKLLHFVDPNRYAIWDSNVCEYLNSLTGSKWKVGEFESYLNYQKLLRSLQSHSVMTELRNTVGHRFDGEVSDLRILEIVMFLTGRKLQIEKKRVRKKLK
jgi:hypothetical protein